VRRAIPVLAVLLLAGCASAPVVGTWDGVVLDRRYQEPVPEFPRGALFVYIQLENGDVVRGSVAPEAYALLPQGALVCITGAMKRNGDMPQARIELANGAQACHPAPPSKRGVST
jgi:hypothetical protein